MRRRTLRAIVGSVASISIAAAQNASDPALNSPGFPVVSIPAFARRDDLPTTQLWNSPSNVLNLEFTPATLVLEVDGELVLRVNVPVYVDLDDDKTGGVHAVGPMLSLKRGGEYAVTIKNSLPSPDLSLPGVDQELQAGIDVTNFHVHGIHEWGGTPEQTMAATLPSNYLGGDNVLLHVEKGETFTWRGKLSEDHLPGGY